MKIEKCQLTDYRKDDKNSVKGERESRTYPGHAPEFALNITSITVEEKTSVLKELIPGLKITFKIKQSIKIPVPNYKTKEYDDESFDVSGEGSGKVFEVLDFDNSEDDDEIQEVTVNLINGYGECL